MFADNQRRAFGAVYALEFAVFFTGCTLWFWVAIGGWSQCSALQPLWPPIPPGAPAQQVLAYPPPAVSSSMVPNSAAAAAQAYYNEKVAAAQRDNVAYTSCEKAFYGGVAGCLAFFSLVLVYGALRRAAMRRRFAIRGTLCADVTAWLCCCFAAVCQEARTLRSFNVVAGEWGGQPAPAGASRTAGEAESDALVPPEKSQEMV
jgi:Cys-rich protein (TIGR01571 family)